MMLIASFPRPHSVDKSWGLEESGNNAKDTPVQYVLINTSEINTNNCACVASFQGPAQPSVASSTEKRGGPGIIYHASDVGVERGVERRVERT